MYRILHYVSIPSRSNGIMSVLMNYMRHIDRTEFRFDFLCFLKPEKAESWEEEIENLGGRVYYTSKPGTKGSVTELRRFFAMHRGEYDVFQLHEVYLAWILRPFSRKYGKIGTFIVQCHATRYSDRKPAAVRNCIFCMPIRHMKGIGRAACSRAAGTFLYGQKQVENGQVFVMTNAVEPDRYAFDRKIRDAERSRLGADENTFLLGHIGRFVPQKNQTFLIELLERLTKTETEDGLRYRLVLAGEGPMEEKIKQLTAEKNLSGRVVFAGKLESSSAVLNAFDLFLLPSLYEGLPMTQIEAESNGLRCLVSDRVTKESAIGGMSQYLPIDTDLWTREIRLISGKKDRKRIAVPADVISGAGFDIRGTVRQYEDYIRRLNANEQ